jgi:hypothetical protein
MKLRVIERGKNPGEYKLYVVGTDGPPLTVRSAVVTGGEGSAHVARLQTCRLPPDST